MFRYAPFFLRAASIIQASCLDYCLSYTFCRLVFNCFVKGHLVHPNILVKSWIEHIIPEDIKIARVIGSDVFWLSSVSTECSRALRNCCLTGFSAAGSFPTPYIFWNTTPHHVHLRSDYLTWDNINTPYSWTGSETTQAHQKKAMLLFASCSVLSETYEHESGNMLLCWLLYISQKSWN